MASAFNRGGQISAMCLMQWIFLFSFAPVAAASTSYSELSASELESLRLEARAYEHGEGVQKDPLKAVSLYCEGARNGDPEAQFSLGWMYANGRGVPRSDETAAYFFKLAVARGHLQARKMLRFVGDTAAPEPDCMNSFGFDIGSGEAFQKLNSNQKKILELVRKLAPEYGVSPRLVMAVIWAESNFEPSALSPKNAQGLMQLIPETSLRFNVKRPFDPEQNIRGGLAYLRWLLAYFEGHVPLVVAAYNAGEGAVNQYKGVPPYAETRGYVKRIMTVFKKNEHPYDPSVTPPSPELSRIRVTNVL